MSPPNLLQGLFLEDQGAEDKVGLGSFPWRWPEWRRWKLGLPRGPRGCGQLSPGVGEDHFCLSQLPFWPSAAAPLGTKAPAGHEGREDGCPYMLLGRHQEVRGFDPCQILSQTGSLETAVHKKGSGRGP